MQTKLYISIESADGQLVVAGSCSLFRELAAFFRTRDAIRIDNEPQDALDQPARPEMEAERPSARSREQATAR